MLDTRDTFGSLRYFPAVGPRGFLVDAFGHAHRAVGERAFRRPRKRRRHTPDQIIRKLAEGNKLLGAGQELGEVCRHLEIAESTWHRWMASTAA